MLVFGASEVLDISFAELLATYALSRFNSEFFKIQKFYTFFGSSSPSLVRVRPL
jgi:hypothetical protein